MRCDLLGRARTRPDAGDRMREGGREGVVWEGGREGGREREPLCSSRGIILSRQHLIPSAAYLHILVDSGVSLLIFDNQSAF